MCSLSLVFVDKNYRYFMSLRCFYPDCIYGRYGKECLENCSSNCVGVACNQTGFCTNGCVAGWTGLFCEGNRYCVDVCALVKKIYFIDFIGCMRAYIIVHITQFQERTYKNKFCFKKRFILFSMVVLIFSCFCYILYVPS